MAGVKGRSGGARPGSGPKKKSAHLRGIDGGASHSSPAPKADVAPTKDAEPFAPPKDLFNEDLMTWEELAPLAFKERTLTPSTSFAFAILCRNIALMRRMYASPLACGGADHRDLIKQVNTGLLSFRLRPNGEALYEPEVETNKPKLGLARFRRG